MTSLESSFGPDSPWVGVPRRALGKTGEEVSMLGLAGTHICPEGQSEAECIDIMRQAINNGITVFDNCWSYDGGRSEGLMGKALCDGYRDKVFLMTKIDGQTEEAAREQLEQSLILLQTDCIDLVQIHEVAEADPVHGFEKEGAIAALLAAKQAGKLRYIGFTGQKNPAIYLKMLDMEKAIGFEFDTVQMPLNVMDAQFRSFEQQVLPVLVERGIGVLGMKSLEADEISESGLLLAEECLRYALTLPTSVIITAIANKAVLDQALRVARCFEPLTPEERNEFLARLAGCKEPELA